MRNYCSKEKNCGTIFKTVQLRKTGQDPMHFFLRYMFFFLQCMFLKVLAPIRPRYGPDTAPPRARYVPDTATEVHFSKNSTAKGWHFLKKSELYIKELIGAIRGEESWTDLS